MLVALAILGIGLGVVFQALGQGLRLRGASAENVSLALVAERLVGGLVGREAAPTEPEEGEDAGCRWRLEAREPVAAATGPAGAGADPGSAGAGGAPVVEVLLTVTAPSGRSWELTTLLPLEKESPR